VVALSKGETFSFKKTNPQRKSRDSRRKKEGPVSIDAQLKRKRKKKVFEIAESGRRARELFGEGGDKKKGTHRAALKG